MSNGDSQYWRNLKRMSPSQKIKAFNQLYWTARELKAAGLRMQYPDISETEVQEKVREIFLRAAD